MPLYDHQPPTVTSPAVKKAVRGIEKMTQAERDELAEYLRWFGTLGDDWRVKSVAELRERDEAFQTNLDTMQQLATSLTRLSSRERAARKDHSEWTRMHEEDGLSYQQVA